MKRIDQAVAKLIRKDAAESAKAPTEAGAEVTAGKPTRAAKTNPKAKAKRSRPSTPVPSPPKPNTDIDSEQADPPEEIILHLRVSGPTAELRPGSKSVPRRCRLLVCSLSL